MGIFYAIANPHETFVIVGNTTRVVKKYLKNPFRPAKVFSVKTSVQCKTVTIVDALSADNQFAEVTVSAFIVINEPSKFIQFFPYKYNLESGDVHKQIIRKLETLVKDSISKCLLTEIIQK